MFLLHFLRCKRNYTSAVYCAAINLLYINTDSHSYIYICTLILYIILLTHAVCEYVCVRIRKPVSPLNFVCLFHLQSLNFYVNIFVCVCINLWKKRFILIRACGCAEKIQNNKLIELSIFCANVRILKINQIFAYNSSLKKFKEKS